MCYGLALHLVELLFLASFDLGLRRCKAAFFCFFFLYLSSAM